ncbi:MAG TPA: cation-translocating P-type ATPase [Candidatus Poseidoniales archaeon]|nr:cation-translocating P-type ATPase [Candidatus Poseidoniales archaeon]
MGVSDDFILVDEEEGDPASEAPVEMPPKAKISLSSRFSGISKTVFSQVGAVKDRLKPRIVEKTEAAVILETEDLSLEIDGVHEFEWPLHGMDCPDCAAKAKRAVCRLPGVKEATISATMGTASIQVDLGAGQLSRIASVLSSLGHEPNLTWHRIRGATASGLAERNSVSRGELKRLFMTVPGILDARFEDARVQIQIVPDLSKEVRGELDQGLSRLVGGEASLQQIESTKLNTGQRRLVLTLPAIAILFVVLFQNGMNESILMALTLIGVALSGWRMFAEAWAGLQNRELGFQLLTSLAVIGALLGSHWGEALMVAILVAVASHMEEAALKKAREAMQGGLDRLPRQARRVSNPTNITGISIADSALIPSKKEEGDGMVPIDLLEVGDRIEIRSGEIVPVDGLVLEGIGSLNRAPLTGESIPMRVTDGDDVHAGLVLDRGPIVIEATAIGQDTRLSGLIEEVRIFRDRPPRVQATVEAFSRIWVPVVLIGAMFAGLVTGDMRLMLLLWVVACPCALLLAAPVPHAAALSIASRSGVVARGGNALEAAARIDLALLDKTGTLTSGHPRLDEIRLSGVVREQALALAAGLEKRSNHPYAAVILSEAKVDIEDVENITDGDAGVEGTLEDERVLFGRKDWLEREGITIPDDLLAGIPKGRGLSILARGDQAIAAFTFIHDDLRPGAAEMIHDLRTMGVAVELLSGDSQSAVEALGMDVGIPAEHCRGEIDPEGKAIWVERRSQGRRTLMAGDGFNDAAALAAADIGVAVGSGEQVNLDAADVLIPGEDPRAIATLVRLARRTRIVVQVNILLSIGVTFLLVYAVLTGWQTNLAVGVAIHEASAFLVIINGAFVATTGNRFALVWEVFVDLFQDYVDAVRMLTVKPSPNPI